MGKNRKLRIYRLYFTESDCYRAGIRQTSIGVQVHSTGADNPLLRRYVQPNDGRLGENTNGNSHNRRGVNVCASAYIGKLHDGTVAVYQTLPWDMRCWLSGKGKNGNANRMGYIGFEICEDDLLNEQYFKEAVMVAAVNLTAHLCEIMNTSPDALVTSYDDGDALAVMDHSELTAVGLASGHADIAHWLKRYGKKMNDFREEVKAAVQEGIEVEYVDAMLIGEEWVKVDTTYEVYASNGGYTNLRKEPTTLSTSLDQLHNGDRVHVLEQNDTWSKVETDQHTGYVMTQFLRIIGQEGATDMDDTEAKVRIVIRDDAGNEFRPVGKCLIDFEAQTD